MNKDFKQLTSACLFKCRCPVCREEVKDRLFEFLQGSRIHCSACASSFVSDQLAPDDAAKIKYLSDSLQNIFRMTA